MQEWTMGSGCPTIGITDASDVIVWASRSHPPYQNLV